VTRRGAHIDARTASMRWLEWSLPENQALDDFRALTRANPAPWIGACELREQAERLSPPAFAQFHANRWGAGEGAWLPPGAWTACLDPDLRVADGESVWLGVDIGGERAATAVVAVTEDLRVAAVEVFRGNGAVLEASACVLRLARRFTIREAAFDPWRFHSEAQRLERDGMRAMVEYPQSHARMVPASEGLHAAIVEQRLRHPGHPELDRHIANAVAKSTPRGWRLDKTREDVEIDAAVALAMAVDRAVAPRAARSRYVGMA